MTLQDLMITGNSHWPVRVSHDLQLALDNHGKSLLVSNNKTYIELVGLIHEDVQIIS